MSAGGNIEATEHDLLWAAYRNFNLRNIDEVLSSLHPDVEWANGMEGGHVHGRENVRAYWTRQWEIFDPHVEPLAIETDPDGRTVVKVHQVVKDKLGKILVDTVVYHGYGFADGLIARMDILTSESETAVSAGWQEL